MVNWWLVTVLVSIYYIHSFFCSFYYATAKLTTFTHTKHSIIKQVNFVREKKMREAFAGENVRWRKEIYSRLWLTLMILARDLTQQGAHKVSKVCMTVTTMDRYCRTRTHAFIIIRGPFFASRVCVCVCSHTCVAVRRVNFECFFCLSLSRSLSLLLVQFQHLLLL